MASASGTNMSPPPVYGSASEQIPAGTPNGGQLGAVQAWWSWRVFTGTVLPFAMEELQTLPPS